MFTTMLNPSPSGSSGAGVHVLVVGGKGGRTGHHRLVIRAAPAPIAEPKSTSEGQCAPVWTREYATPSAAGANAAPNDGLTSPTPTAKATAEAEWPDGMDELLGCGWTNLNTGRCSGSGRARGNRVLKTPLVTAEATAWAMSPCRAARRGLPGIVAMTPATAIHSFPWLAEAESLRKKTSW